MNDKIYAGLFRCPPSPDSPVIYDYARHQEHASYAHGYFKVKVAVPVALGIAKKCPYPDAVKVGIMKQVANYQEITLQQMRILLGYAARRAQHTGRER